MSIWQSAAFIAVAAVLVILNGFFVAAEFALVKVRSSRLDEMVRLGRPLGRLARWLGRRLDASLSACQLGITMASLALGWVGEPAFEWMLHPLFEAMHLEEEVVTGISLALSLLIMTGLHLVVGEQVPKIFAIRRPELLLQWCAAPLAFFYFLFFPLLWLLSVTTSLLLRLVGVTGGSGHDLPHSEEELRALMMQAHAHGELTRSEHALLNAVFEFDDLLCRRVMVPRNDVIYFNVGNDLSDCLEIVQRTMHTRYPVCEGSLDKVVGVAHVKDLLGRTFDQPFSLREIMRPPRRVPETMPVSKLLRHFQATRQLLALVVDEYGTVIGIVTLENVLEQIVGPVEDEFDAEPPEIAPSGPDEFIVLGATPVETVNKRFGLTLDSLEADTLSGFLMSQVGRILEQGDRVSLGGAVAEVVEVKGSRAVRVKVNLGASVPENNGRQA